MADIGIHSGGEHTLIYRVKADHTGVVQADGTTTATTNAHALIALQTGLVKPKFGVDGYTFELVKHDTALLDFIAAHAAPVSASTASGEQVFAEAGTEWNTDTDASSLNQLLIVWAGSTNTDGRNTCAALCTLNADARNFEVEYKKWSRRTLNFTPVKAKAALAIVNGLLPTGKYGAGATITVPINEFFKQAFLATT